MVNSIGIYTILSQFAFSIFSFLFLVSNNHLLPLTLEMLVQCCVVWMSVQNVWNPHLNHKESIHNIHLFYENNKFRMNYSQLEFFNFFYLFLAFNFHFPVLMTSVKWLPVSKLLIWWLEISSSLHLSCECSCKYSCIPEQLMYMTRCRIECV